jgi:protein SCO1
MSRRITANLMLSVAVTFLVTAVSLFANSTVGFAQQRQTSQYVCPMHAAVVSKKPGKCPKCGMALRVSKADPESAGDSSGTTPRGERANDATNGTLSLRIPDTQVYDQNGQQLRFYSDLIKGKTVAINFVFTSCTTICPPLTATFRRVQQELGDRVGRDVQLISVSVDPTTDVPERLKSFAAKFNVGPGWTFVTGNKPEIDLLLRALGAYVGDKNDHTPMILIGNDKASYWTRAYGLAKAKVITQIVNEAALKSASALDNRNKAGAPTDSDDQAVRVPLPGASRNKNGVAERLIQRGPSTTARSLQNSDTGESKGTNEDKRTPSEVAASYFPNLPLLTQDNKPVRFYDDLMKGKVVVINFMFTTCAGICSPMTANLVKVQQYLADHIGRDVNMISLSVDPAVDTPEALKKYADNYNVKPGWYFLTGKKENVDWVLHKLGGYVEDKATHNTFLIIGNEATGQWMKMFAMSKPKLIADAIVKLIATEKD